MKEKFTYYLFRGLTVFSITLMLVAIMSAFHFATLENYNSMFSALFGFAVGIILLLAIDNRTKQIAIITGLTDVFVAFEKDLEIRSNLPNFQNEDVVVRSFSADSHPEELKDFLDSFQNIFHNTDLNHPNPDNVDMSQMTKEQLLVKLKHHINNEEYELAEKVKIELEKKKSSES